MIHTPFYSWGQKSPDKMTWYYSLGSFNILFTIYFYNLNSTLFYSPDQLPHTLLSNQAKISWIVFDFNQYSIQLEILQQLRLLIYIVRSCLQYILTIYIVKQKDNRIHRCFIHPLLLKLSPYYIRKTKFPTINVDSTFYANVNSVILYS